MRRFQEREIVVRSFQKKFGRPPDLKNPTTFNEKVTYKQEPKIFAGGGIG